MSVKVRLWQLRKTDRAILFCTLPPDDPTGREVWLPRSAMEHISRDLPLPDGTTPCTVTVAEWLAEKEDL